MLALINSLLPFIWHDYGDVGHYCWIKMTKDGAHGHSTSFALRLSLRYIVAFSICVFNAVLYVKMYLYFTSLANIRKNADFKDSHDLSDKAKSTIQKFIYYPSACYYLIVTMYIVYYLLYIITFDSCARLLLVR